MQNFYEIDITYMKKEELIRIYKIVRYSIDNPDCGWCKKIYNLEMILDEDDHIIIRGWATKSIWNRFLKYAIYRDF